VCRGVFIQSDKDPIDLRRKAALGQTVRNEALGTLDSLGPCRKAQLRVAREIENPETGLHFEPPQGARAQGKWCPVLHGAKLAVDDDPAESFGRPDEFFEARAANRVVDHFGPKPLGAFKNGRLDILTAGDFPAFSLAGAPSVTYEPLRHRFRQSSTPTDPDR